MSQRLTDLDGWMRDVCGPANPASEGKRVVRSNNGQDSASYVIAQLPDGRWAIRVRCHCDDGRSGMGLPWEAFATRDEAVVHFLEEARRFFGEKEQEVLCAAKARARRQILQLLRGDLFGWKEPEPEAQG